MNSSTSLDQLLVELIAEADEQNSQWPQYAGHFDGYVLGRIRRDIRTKMGLAFTAGEVVLIAPAEPGFHSERTAYSRRNRIDTAIRGRDVVML